MGSQEQGSVVVTGASGTLGYNMVRLLAGDGAREVILPLRSLHPALFDQYPNVRTIQADLADPVQAAAILKEVRPTTIVHCAASGVRPIRPAWFEMTNFNVQATVKLFEASCAIPDCHFIYISTGLVYQAQNRPLAETDPIGTLHPYGASKAAAECLLQACATEFSRKLTVLRPFSFTGLHDGGGRLFPSLLRAAAAGDPVRLSPGAQFRDFCSVQDIAGAVATVLNRNGMTKPIEVYNLGSGETKTLREILENICEEIGLEVDLQFGQLPYHPYEPMHLVADISKAAELPWRPATNLAFAVWELAQADFPELKLRRPETSR
jgi:nucleoside-diphosphate-sugar epimerase